MIINNHYRFVFVHNPKTAGTSIRTALKALPGDNQFAAPARGHTKHETPALWLDRLGVGLDDRMPGGDAAIRDYLFFSFVRNPWDRFCSFHRYHRRKNKYPVPESIDEFALSWIRGDPWIAARAATRRQVNFAVAPISFVGRFETLSEDYAEITDRLGFKANLPRLNATNESCVSYRDVMNARTAELIRRYYAEDIGRFGYAY